MSDADDTAAQNGGLVSRRLSLRLSLTSGDLEKDHKALIIFTFSNTLHSGEMSAYFKHIFRVHCDFLL